MRTLVAIALLVFAPALAGEPSWKAPLREAISDRSAKREFVDGAFAVVTPFSVEIETAGRAKGETIFEIGSVTKALTGIALAQLVLERKVRPDDPVARHVPELAGTFAGAVTLEQLALHTSGLSRIPDDLPRTENPYAGYDWPRLLKALKAHPIPGIPKPYPAAYSNTGFALLGVALARADRLPYEEMIRRRILRPLAMGDTSVVVRRADLGRFIDGYGAGLRRVPHWDWDVFAPTGGLRSTIADMARFARANLIADDRTAFGRALRLSQTKSWGWDTAALGLPFPFKNGGTGGFSALLAIDHRRALAAVILTNTTADPTELLVPMLTAPR